MIRPVLIVLGIIVFLIVAMLVASSRRRRCQRRDRAERSQGNASGLGTWVCHNELCRAESPPHARFCGMCGMARSDEKLDQ